MFQSNEPFPLSKNLKLTGTNLLNQQLLETKKQGNTGLVKRFSSHVKPVGCNKITTEKTYMGLEASTFVQIIRCLAAEEVPALVVKTAPQVHGQPQM